MTRRLVWAFAAAAIGCTATPGDPNPGDVGGEGDGTGWCDDNGDCNDGLDCTVDSCGVGHACEFTPVDGLCSGEDETCVPGRGCVAGACTSSAQCDDAVECTTDTCGVSGTCEHTPLDALCDDGFECDTTAGCSQIGDCLTGADCDDSTACTADRCTVTWTCENVADDDLCDAGERCASGMGCYTPLPCPGGTDEECQDGNVCNGSERCDPEFGCIAGDLPPSDYCLDEDPCTDDVCDMELGRCTHTFNPEISGCSPFDINGCYDIGRTVSQTCAGGEVNYNFSQLCFTQVDTYLEVDAGGRYKLSTSSHPASDYAFDVTYQVVGDCTENYRIVGEFSDDNTFSATFTFTFTGPALCALVGCARQSIAITGTRI